LKWGETLPVGCRTGAGSTSPASHAMGDSDTPFAAPATLAAADVASRTSAFLLGWLFFYPCELRVEAGSKSVFQLLGCCIIYTRVYVYVQASRSVPAESQLPWNPLDMLSWICIVRRCHIVSDAQVWELQRTS